MPTTERITRYDPEAELFRLLVENVRDSAIFVTDTDGRVVTWNPGAERLLGYTEEEILGRPFDLFFTPQDRAASVPRRELEEARATGRGSDDRWHVRKDGSLFWAGGSVTPLGDGDQLRGFAKIMRDLTGLKRAADEAQERERLAVFTAAVGRALTRDGDQREALSRCAQAMVAHLGVVLARVWTLNEREGVLELQASAGMDTRTDGTHGRVRVGQYKIGQIAQDRTPQLTNSVLGDLRIHDQEWARREGIVAFAGYPLLVGDRVVGVVAVFARQALSDSTLAALATVAGEVALAILRLRAEEALRASEERFRGLMEQAPFSVQVFDATGRTLRVNRAWEELWGVTLDQIADYNVLRDPQLEAKGVLPHLHKAFDGEPAHIPAIQYDINETAPGRTRHAHPARWVSAVAYPIRDAAGRVLEVILVHEDETERKRAEDALKEAGRKKDEFLALLGHELRNPLAPIRNAVAMLGMRGDDPAAVSRALAILDRQTAQMTRLVDELLDASRVARGKVRLAVAPLDLAALVRTAVEDHRHEAEVAGLSVEVMVPAEPVPVRGDAARLTQVVTNLLHNAVKFTPKDGRVTVRLEVGEAEAALSVSDTGVGIAPVDLPALFEPFHQVDADAARTKGGLGLGLAVVKGLVELHGGSVAAESAGTGRGATFTVRLPLGAGGPLPAPDAPAPAADLQQASARRLVIVEDLADAAESLAELLEMKGFVVSVATNGPEGIELCRREQPDAVVCDLGLPGMSGFDVARSLRADSATAGAVLVAVSGYAQEEDRQKALAAGFDALLAKPADTDELARLLARVRG